MRFPEDAAHSEYPGPFDRVQLSRELAERLYALAGMTTDLDAFQHRMETVLTRFERYKFYDQATPLKKRRQQLEKLEKAAFRYLGALDDQGQDVQNELDGLLDEEDSRRWEKRSIYGGDPIPAPKFDIENVRASASSVLRATRRQLEWLRENAGNSRRGNHIALNQLITDLLVVYDTGTPENKRSYCYYDATSETYAGQFLEFALVLLDEYAPKSYFSKGALGKRIFRVMSDEIY